MGLVSVADWPLSAADRESVTEDLQAELEHLARLNDTEPLPGMAWKRELQIRMSKHEIERLEAMLADDGATT